ncbi:hypothetical protein HPB47_025740, partial [Ixodes persulcatus]
CRGDVSELVATAPPLSMSEVEVVEAGSSSKRKRNGVWKFFDRSCAASSKCLVCENANKHDDALLNHLKCHSGARKEYESAAAAAEQRNAEKPKDA